MITDQGEVQVIDFNSVQSIDQIDEDGLMTDGYAGPERISEGFAAKTTFYSLEGTLEYLIKRYLSQPQLVDAALVLKSCGFRVALPYNVERLIEIATAHDSESRFESAADFAAACRDVTMDTYRIR